MKTTENSQDNNLHVQKVHCLTLNATFRTIYSHNLQFPSQNYTQHLNLLAMPEPVHISGTPKPKTKFVDKKQSSSDHVSTCTNISQKVVISPAPLLPTSSLKQTEPTTATDPATSKPPINNHEENDLSEKRELTSALSASSRVPKFTNYHFKSTSEQTESNTHANAYTFVSSAYNTPLGSPFNEINNPLISEGCIEHYDLNSQDSGKETSRNGSFHIAQNKHRIRGPHSRSVGGFNGSSRAGSSVEGHFIDPDSPSAAFEHRVAFDTFDNKYATDFSLTLQTRHMDYQHSRLSRTFMCGTDKNKYSENALCWLLEKLADDGDEILCLRVIDPSSKISSSDKALEEKQYRDEANKFLEHLISKNTKGKKIAITLEFTVGTVEAMIKRMIEIHEPSILVVGTKGRSREGFKGLLPGSVSKWCLQHSPIPVVVVKPADKQERIKTKREADPNQLSYLDMISAHPDEEPKTYHHMSSSNLLAPQLPLYLQQRSVASTPVSALSSTTSLADTIASKTP